MSLYDQKGGSYFEPGEFRARITNLKKFQANSGNYGLEITFADEVRSIRDSLMLMDSCAWRMAKLAEACGMTDEQMKKIQNVNDVRLHKWLLNKECMIVVVKGAPTPSGKSYSEVADYFKIAVAKPPLRQAEAAPPASQESDNPPISDDGIPF